jgi:O-antigen/teichoic acid export membrane protein
MAAIGPWLLGEIYGPEFERFGYLVPILALRHAISVTAFGPSIGIKVAGIVRETFRARLALTAVALPATAVATARFGLAGAAWASVVSALVLAFVLYLVFVPGVARAAAAPAAT